MLKSTRCLARMTLVFACLAGAAAYGDVRLPHVISDRMVLQRDAPIPIRGWADPGEKVTVALGTNNEASAVADAAGNWIVKLAPMKAGGPFTMTVSGRNKITLGDILVGEVWIGSGQSNMQWGTAACRDGEQEVAAADYPGIRLFLVPTVLSWTPRDDVAAEWQKCSPQSVPSFSGTLYYFGRYLHKELGVPVGLIASSWGGSPIEAWIPGAGYAGTGELAPIAEKIRGANQEYLRQLEQAQAANARILADGKKAFAETPLMPAVATPALPEHPHSAWGAPESMYNAMIRPLVPFAVRGAVWYQGESNVGDPLYIHKMRALVEGWRKEWGQEKFSFYWAQLAPYTYGADPYRLPRIWEAQTAAMVLPDTGMAVLTDIGNVHDIHPLNKQDAGKRLALWALAKDYGKNIVYSGPMFRSFAVEGSAIRVRFDHAGGGLQSRDGRDLDWFEVFDDEKTAPARAVIDGDTVLVSSDMVPRPVGVRFGWNQAAEPNLQNKDGLPAGPFRTDCTAPNIAGANLFVESTQVELTSVEPDAEIRYTLDGSNPTARSDKYQGPVTIGDTCTVKARAFRKNGRQSMVAASAFTKVDPRYYEGKMLAPGIRYEYYEGDWQTLPDFNAVKPLKSGTCAGISLDPCQRNTGFALRFTGYFEVAQAGAHTFELASDDGSRLYVDGRELINMDGAHAAFAMRGTAELEPGMHGITVVYFQGNGGALLTLSCQAPGSDRFRDILPWYER